MSEETKKAWLNPKVYVELRVSAINRLNNLIDKAEPKAVVEVVRGDYKRYECPICGRGILDMETDHYCRQCGQKLDTENIAL